ncbi:MAG: hypothetical protein KIS66_13025 [Fimbriimonadaceae bacterium]|nr:hypothetical protein [Fimbriimonadaceae bacterium]
MTLRGLARWPASYAGAALLSVGIGGLSHGPKGAAGVAIGIAATGFGLFALWRVMRLLGDTCGDRKTPPREALGAIAALLLKFPVLFGGFAAARALGDGAPPCFLGGLGLVYSALIVWALAAS